MIKPRAGYLVCEEVKDEGTEIITLNEVRYRIVALGENCTFKEGELVVPYFGAPTTKVRLGVKTYHLMLEDDIIATL